MFNNMNDTMKFQMNFEENNDTPLEVLNSVLEALKEKGYDPINQLVGYLMSGDPTYITSFKNARSVINRVERDELLEILVGFYLSNAPELQDEEE